MLAKKSGKNGKKRKQLKNQENKNEKKRKQASRALRSVATSTNQRFRVCKVNLAILEVTRLVSRSDKIIVSKIQKHDKNI